MMRQAADFQPYFRAIFDRVGLKDWHVDVLDEPPQYASSYAHVECLYGRKFASVQLSINFLEGSEEAQRHGTIHETLHAHMACADLTVRELVGDKRYDLYRLPMEYGIDGIAVAIAPLFPLPSDILGPSPEKSSHLDENSSSVLVDQSA